MATWFGAVSASVVVTAAITAAAMYCMLFVSNGAADRAVHARVT